MSKCAVCVIRSPDRIGAGISVIDGSVLVAVIKIGEIIVGLGVGVNSIAIEVEIIIEGNIKGISVASSDMVGECEIEGEGLAGCDRDVCVTDVEVGILLEGVVSTVLVQPTNDIHINMDIHAEISLIKASRASCALNERCPSHLISFSCY